MRQHRRLRVYTNQTSDIRLQSGWRAGFILARLTFRFQEYAGFSNCGFQQFSKSKTKIRLLLSQKILQMEKQTKNTIKKINP